MKTTRIYLSIIAVLITTASSFVNAQPSYPTDPKKAQLIYTDVVHFIEALEHLKTNPDTLSVLNQYYFDRGSVGLQEYITKHALTPEKLKNAMAKAPDRYLKIAAFYANKDAFAPEFKSTMQAFGQVLENAMYPPTYFLVGANRGVGQASKVGQLITVTRVVDNATKLKQLIVHELAHFQQAITMGIQKYGALYTQKGNMLPFCLREGGAEFVTWLVLSQITQTKSLAYLERNESKLKSRFSMDLDTQDSKFWLWDSLDDPNTPKLMGYVMGFKICEAYYKKAEDKKAALTTILIMEQPQVFLETSGYFN